MRSTPATNRDTRPRRAWLGALACLFAWCMGMSAFLPAATAALGALDGQHRVSFVPQQGQISVVFHHPDAAQARTERHSLLTELLTRFAPASDPAQDHVITFAQADTARLTAAVAPPTAPFQSVPPPAESFVLLPKLPAIDVPALEPRPPPVAAFALVCLRSTTLLI